MIENTGNEPLSNARFQTHIEAFSEDQKAATKALNDTVAAINILTDKTGKIMQHIQDRKPVAPVENNKLATDVIRKEIAEIKLLIKSRPKKVFNWPQINLFPEENPKLFYKAMIILLAVTLSLNHLYRFGVRWSDNKRVVEMHKVENRRIHEAWYNFYINSNKSIKRKMDEAYNDVQMDKK